jgi:broad specificity phosphatase PhoE
MEIVLIRHGKPAINTSGKTSAADFGRWVKQYDQAGIIAEHQPPNEALEIANQCSFIVCSHLPRSIESAKALNIEAPNIMSDFFRECEMPHANWTFPKLSITSWSMLFRAFQLMGYSPNAESYKAIKRRSAECAKQLAKLSEQHQSVLVIGHGALIWFLHKQLIRMGWSGPQKAATKHWGFGVYSQ